MPDITKCTNRECPIRTNCWRFTAPSSDRQSVSMFKYEDGCSHYWPESYRNINPKKSNSKNERSL